MPALYEPIEHPTFVQVDAVGQATTMNRRMSAWESNNKWYMAPFRRFAKIKDRSRRADYCARIGFPFVFVMFNIVYWILFTPRSLY